MTYYFCSLPLLSNEIGPRSALALIEIAYRLSHAYDRTCTTAIGDPVLSGAEGTRTLDLLNAIEMRSQLRYSPSL